MPSTAPDRGGDQYMFINKSRRLFAVAVYLLIFREQIYCHTIKVTGENAVIYRNIHMLLFIAK